MPDDQPLPRSRLTRFRRSGWGGCLLWAVAFVLVVVGGCVVGVWLRPDPNARFTARQGDGFTLRGYRDEVDAPCLELVREGEVQAGQCGYGTGGAYTVTTLELRDGRLLAFAPVPEGAVEVRLRTVEGTEDVAVEEREGIRWFLYDGVPLADDPAVPLDAQGEPVPVPTGG